MPFIVKMPKLSPTMEEGQIAKWHKKENDFVETGDLLLEITTDKATVEYEALDEGYLRKFVKKEGELAKVNEPIAIFSLSKDEAIEDIAIAPKAEKPKKEPLEKKEEKKEESFISLPIFTPEPPLKMDIPRERTGRIKVSPLAKKISEKKGLDLASIQGTGHGGRITVKDLEHAQPKSIVSFTSKSYTPIAPGSYEEIALTPMRKAIAKKLQQSKSSIPHFYVKKVVDATAFFSLYQELKKMHFRLTVNDLLIKACAYALRKHPEVNRGFNSATEKIIQFQTIDISVAVTLKEGLITPIIRKADEKTLPEIAKEVKELAEKAATLALKEEEYKGGSFCISNLGMFGIDAFLAVINPPQAAILAVGAIKDAVLVKEGQMVVGKTLILNLSCDHRVIDGALAAQFLQTLAFLIENPSSLLLL